MSATPPAEWAAAGSLGVTAISVIALGMAFVDADAAYFDPRPAVRRATGAVHQAAVFAGHDLARATAAIRHELAPPTACVWHAAYTARETARDAVALLLLLTTSPKAGTR
jgi:hypothetical protein